MGTVQTARERARAEITREITDEARRQLAADGAPALSLRAVARALGMASSALYRYFASRDELLTALIIDAYDAMGEAAETAEATCDRADFRGRWSAVCTAVRRWALAHPHEYALVFGSPVPGYRAPEDTIAPATRVPRLLAALLRDAAAAGTLVVHADDPAPRGALDRDIETLMSGVPPATVVRGVIAWTHLYGAISFELFGHLRNVVDDTETLFGVTVDHLADLVGLPAAT